MPVEAISIPPKAKQDAPPKGPTGTAARPSTSSRAKVTSLEDDIGAALVLVNLPLLVMPGLALDEAEIAALAISLNDQCRRSPRFKKYVEKALTITSGGQLATVGLMIGARRAVRFGALRVVMGPQSDFIAPVVDAGLGDQLRKMAKLPPEQPRNSPAPPEEQMSFADLMAAMGVAPTARNPEQPQAPFTGNITPDMMRPAPPVPDA